MVYRNNAGRLGSGFMSLCLETHWLGQKAVSMSRNDPVGRTVCFHNLCLTQHRNCKGTRRPVIPCVAVCCIVLFQIVQCVVLCCSRLCLLSDLAPAHKTIFQTANIFRLLKSSTNAFLVCRCLRPLEGGEDPENALSL